MSDVVDGGTNPPDLPGPAGYAICFADEGNIVVVAIVPRKAIGDAIPSASWRGIGKLFGDKVQWVMRYGRPVAAVVRTWRRDDFEREI